MKLRKLAAWLVGIVIVLVGAAAVIPRFVDVDRYRPLLLSRANRLINGQIDLGRLQLSLWGRIKVDVAGLSVKDSGGGEILEVKDASFLLPFSSILSAAPRLTLVLNRPKISVVRDQKGRLNLLSLMKEAQVPGKGSRPGDGHPEKKKQGDDLGQIEIPAIVARARLGVEIRDGVLGFSDLQSETDARVEELQVALRDASISQPTELSVRARVQASHSSKLRVSGPVQLKMNTNPVISGGELKEMGATLELSGSDLEMLIPELFHKKAGVPMTLSGRLGIGTQELRVDSLLAQFHQSRLDLAGRIDRLDSNPSLALKVRSNAIDFASWGALVPALDAFRPSGSATLSAEVSGPASALRYSGDLSLSSVSFHHSLFSTDPQINGRIRFATDFIEDLEIRLTAPATEMMVKGRLRNFMKPNLNLQVSSSGIDLDQWLDLGASGKSPTSPSKGESKESSGSSQSQNFDALIDPLRKSEIVRSTIAAIDVKIAQFRAFRMPLSNVEARLSAKDLGVSLDSASLSAFGGKVSASASLDLKPSSPTYDFSAKVDGLQLERAVESQVAFLKNTLLGTLKTEIRASGAGFNPDRALQNLSMKGSFEVRKAKFATIDISRMAVDGLNQAIERASAKVPALKGRSLGTARSRESSYEIIRSGFSLSKGRFSAPDFEARAVKNQGIDLKGRLMVTLSSLALDARFELQDTYNLTGARDVSVDVGGQVVAGILAEKGRPVRLPISVGCTLAKPCPSYADLPEHFAKVALSNLTGTVREKVTTEAKKKVGEALKKGLPKGFKSLFR